MSSFDSIQLAVDLAEKKKSEGDLNGAYGIYVKILSERLFARTNLDYADLIFILSLVDLATLFADFVASDDLLNGAVLLCENEGNYAIGNFITIKRIQLAIDRGLLAETDVQNLEEEGKDAKTLLRSLFPQIGDIESINISHSGLIQWEKSCTWKNADSADRAVLFSQLYLTMGRLLFALGQYGSALIMLERGLSYTTTESTSLVRQTILPIEFAITAAYLEKGELIDAANKLQTLETKFDPELQPEALIRWLELSGKIDLLQGRFGEALIRFQRIQDICQNINLPHAIALSTLNLAHVLILLNQTNLAKYHLSLLSDTYGDQDVDLQQRIIFLLQLADARSSSFVNHSPASVLEMRRKAKTSNDSELEKEFLLPLRSPNYLALFEYRVLQVHCQLSRFEFIQAETTITHIQQAFGLSDSKLIKIKITILTGMLAYYQGVKNSDLERINKASLILYDIGLALQNLKLKPDLWQVRRFLSWCWLKLEYPIEKREYLQQMTEKLLAELTASLPSQNRATYLLNKWTADEEYLAGRINQIQRQERSIGKFFFLHPWRQWDLMQKLHSLLEHIDRYKYLLAKPGSQDPIVKISPPQSLFKRLLNHPRDRITLSFLVLPDRILIIKLGWLMLDFRIISMTRVELRDLVQTWHQTIQRINQVRDFKINNSADNLIQENHHVFGSVAERLEISNLLNKVPKIIKAITIVPDDILHGFPFSTVIHEGKYLIERYAISIAYQARDITLPNSRFLPSEKALVVGVSTGNKEFNCLPGVTKEVEKVGEWLNRHQFEVQNITRKINKEEIIKSLASAKLFHIACHGTFEYNNPDRSGLALISDNSQLEVLSFSELSNLDLTKLCHATLSCCWSADYFILPGRWIISLPETLWRSGVHSILACLWEVSDKVAIAFMTRFYEYLETFSREEALRLTQIDCLKSRLPHCQGIDTTKYLIWAGFNIYGDRRKITFINNF